MALQSNRAVDPKVLVVARAEHRARMQLAAQAERNRAAAWSGLVDEASDDAGEIDVAAHRTSCYALRVISIGKESLMRSHKIASSISSIG